MCVYMSCNVCVCVFQGDSGGALVSKEGSVWVGIGVVSFGIGCGEAQYPGVYSRVSQYQSWINSHISSSQPGFVQITSQTSQANTASPTNTAPHLSISSMARPLLLLSPLLLTLPLLH